MYYSLFEIFSIGVGPSSSHTVGPMRAAKRYLDNIRSAGKFEAVSRIDVTLYGSLALTGVGHGTVKAVVYGLMGLEAEAIDPEKPYVNAVERDKILHLGQERAIPFDLDANVIFKKDTFLPEHSNGMKFTAYDNAGKVLLEEVYFSVGGGTIARQDEISRRVEREPYNVPYQFDSCKELMEQCEKNGISISELVLRNEESLRTPEEVRAGIAKINRIMQSSIDRGMHARGILPGGLNIKRRAAGIYERLEEKSAGIEHAFKSAVEKYHVKAQVNRVGSLMSIFFTDKPVKSFDDVRTSNLAQFTQYFRVMKAHGMYIAPSQYEAFFVNDALSEADLQKTESAIDAALSQSFDQC